MRRQKHFRKFIGIFLLLSVIVLAYIFFVKLDDNTEKRNNETTKEDTHFISFCDQYQPNWLKMIKSSLATLDYFQNHLDELVTDVAVGTRIMEAQINILLKTKVNLSPNVLQDLHTLQRKSKSVGDTILQNFKALQNSYGTENYMEGRLTKNLQWIESASTWETPGVKQWKTLLEHDDADITVASSVSMDIDFGKYSDGCIFGTFENCDIPDYCMEFLWREPHSGYLLTHQILFHYMIIQNNCFSGGKRIFYESQKLVDPKKFLGTMCRRALTEAALIQSINYPYSHRDLFAENILVCSLAGYNDFLTNKWANVILHWAAEDGVLGCYTTDEVVPKRRVKRWDNFFKIGNLDCSVHMGALTLGVIGQQLRYFLEMCHDS